jgi:Protein of unknown function (DUF2924)
MPFLRSISDRGFRCQGGRCSGCARLVSNAVRAALGFQYIAGTHNPLDSWDRDFAPATAPMTQGTLCRVVEVACDADPRLPPQSKTAPTPPPLQPIGVPAPVDHRLPPPGTILTRPYKDQLVQVQGLTEGFAYGGRVFPSLSAVAKAITGSHCNGYHYLRLVA